MLKKIVLLAILVICSQTILGQEESTSAPVDGGTPTSPLSPVDSSPTPPPPPPSEDTTTASTAAPETPAPETPAPAPTPAPVPGETGNGGGLLGGGGTPGNGGGGLLGGGGTPAPEDTGPHYFGKCKQRSDCTEECICVSTRKGMKCKRWRNTSVSCPSKKDYDLQGAAGSKA